MKEEIRLKELQEYCILDTDPEVVLDDFVEIASVICDTSISLITLLDYDRQWFKANKGLKLKQTPKSYSFCQHTLNKPYEVLVVNDALKDERFVDNPLVNGYPNIRFYAGAPLTTPSGNVLGTLCVIDEKPKKFSVSKKKALQLMAKKVMDYLNERKVILEQKRKIENIELKLKNLTDQAPGVIFQFRMTKEGKMSFDFISNGIKSLHSDLSPESIVKSPELAFGVIHPEDLAEVMESIQKSFISLSEWNVEFRSLSKNNEIRWQMGRSNPEKQANGDVVWYGTYQDITDDNHLTTKKIKKFVPHIKTVSQELDEYTRRLNEVYQSKKKSN